MLEPILKLIRRTGRDTRTLVQEIINLDLSSQHIDTRKLDKKMDELGKSFEQFAREYVETSAEWAELRGQVEVLQGKLREAAETVPHLAEKIADAETIAIQMDELLGYAPIKLARDVLGLQDELFEVAVQEIATHPNGKEKLQIMRNEIERRLNES